jgi:hypothetical protein
MCLCIILQLENATVSSLNVPIAKQCNSVNKKCLPEKLTVLQKKNVPETALSCFATIDDADWSKLLVGATLE